MSSQPKFVNAAGVMVLSVSCRLVPAVVHLETVLDIASAVAWISRTISKHYGIRKRLLSWGNLLVPIWTYCLCPMLVICRPMFCFVTIRKN